MGINKADIHEKTSLVGYIFLSVGMVYSKAFMSIGVIILALNTILEGNFSLKYKLLKDEKSIQWLLLFFLLFILSFTWSTDINYALKDLKIKLPLLLLPIIAVCSPMNQKSTKISLGLLLASLLSSSIINIGAHQGWWMNKTYYDIRQLSLFGSHIRYGILIGLGLLLSFYFMKEKKYYLLFIPLIIWFIFYTYYSQVLSGIISVIIVLTFTFLHQLKLNHPKFYKVSIASISILLISISLYLFSFLRTQPKAITKSPKYTSEGNLYYNEVVSQSDQKKSTYIAICDIELKRDWEKVSEIPYNGKDKKGQFLRYTLIRFLESKNLTLDALGLKKLSKKEIISIENGIANVHELNPGLISRLYRIKYQLSHSFDPNGGSILQRIEYWKNGFALFKANLLFGVGAGDNQIAFDNQYEISQSVLLKENRLRAHNQFLTIGISLGIIGLIPFILFFRSLIKTSRRKAPFFISVALTVIIITALFEDTFETQLGVMIGSFFVALTYQLKKQE